MLKRIVAFILLLTLIGCGKSGPECFTPGTLQSFGSSTDASDMPLDPSIPQDQQSSIKNDLKLLGSVNLSENAADACVMGIEKFTGTNLVQYLKTRVRYIVGETFDYRKPTVVASREDSANPFIYSSGTVSPAQLSEVVTVMTNVGAYLYLVGKQKNVGYALNVMNSQILINSPRDGIVQIGKGMFTANQIPSSSRDSRVNSLLRLAVMMHEARHSDGHGNHAAFPHMICAEGDYEGSAACEDNTNGPYAVQAMLTRKFIEACTGCSTTEKEGMVRLQADYESRLDSDAIARDDRPEGFWK